MEIPEDFSELLQLLNSNGVDYLVVGGYALGFHGAPRYTGDLDLFIAASPENADSLLQAVGQFGFASLGLTRRDFTESGNVIQLGYPPVRVDLLTQISGVDWQEAWEDRIATTLSGIPVNVISREHLIRNKKASGRAVDLGDVERLQ